MEDAFVILLFTFFTQQLQLLWRRSEDDDSDPPLRSQSDPQHTERPGSSKKQPSSTAFFPWLEVDVQADECRDYFPADVIRNVIPNPSNPTPLKLSVVLEAFQQFFGKFQALLRENQSLQRRGRMYDDLFKKYRILEEKLAKSRLDQTSGHNGLTHGHATDLMKQKIAELQEQLRQVGPLQRAYARSEDRCKQLVEVTQQWSIECEGKMKVVRILEKEVEQLKAQVQHLEGRVNKYKKYWADTKDLHLGRATDAQFEELRSELASRRLLYDQVCAFLSSDSLWPHLYPNSEVSLAWRVQIERYLNAEASLVWRVQIKRFPTCE